MEVTELPFKKVLVVDDCQLVRKRLIAELSALGYLVETAADGVEALKMIEKHSYNFLLTDWEMPNMDGETLCRCVRATNTSHYVYIIMMTAHSNNIDVVTGMKAGADDFIVKPIDTRELAARLLNGSRVLSLDRNLTNLAIHDPLTGVLNRRTYGSGIASEMELAHRRGLPLSYIMLDIDNFKLINDTYGHMAGDNVLISVANTLNRRFRSSDSVFRYGGEEFAVILSGADESSAAICAERCRKDIAEMDYPAFVNMRVTVSCGVAEVDSFCITPMELTDRADLALRLAKKMGRNQTVRYSQCEAHGLHSVGLAPSANSAAASRGTLVLPKVPPVAIHD